MFWFYHQFSLIRPSALGIEVESPQRLRFYEELRGLETKSPTQRERPNNKTYIELNVPPTNPVQLPSLQLTARSAYRRFPSRF